MKVKFSNTKRVAVTGISRVLKDALVNLDMSKMYAWSKDHKKKFSSGVKAR